MAQLEASGEIPDLPSDLVDLEVVTGVEALGRGHDLNKLAQFLELQASNPAAQTYLNWQKIMIMEATALGIDTEELIKTDEQLQQEQQQQMMSNVAEKAAPQVAKGMMDNGGM